MCGKEVTLFANNFIPLYFLAYKIIGPHFDRVNDKPFCSCECGTKHRGREEHGNISETKSSVS